MTIRISAQPHPGQKEVHYSLARFKVIAAGRRWGKTRLGVFEVLNRAIAGGRCFWTAPSYKLTEVGWRPLVRLSRQIPGVEIKMADRQIIYPSGGWIYIRSTDREGGLRSEGLDFLVMDECAFSRESAWTEELRPALIDQKGEAMFISTPNGRNWFWRLWITEQDEWQSFQFSTYDNPFIDPGEIEQAGKELPEKIFKQEILAKFIEDDAAVFRNLNSCLHDQGRDHRQGSYKYYVGVDLAKQNDFTVISVLESRPNGELLQVYMDRFNQIDYLFQLERLKTVNHRFSPEIILVEQNSAGIPFLELCERENLPVEGFVTSNKSKKGIIEGLSLALERGEIKILNNTTQLNELRAFEVKRLPSGKLRYSAPEGLHDDTVISLALSLHAAESGAPGMVIFDGGLSDLIDRRII